MRQPFTAALQRGANARVWVCLFGRGLDFEGVGQRLGQQAAYGIMLALCDQLPDLRWGDQATRRIMHQHPVPADGRNSGAQQGLQTLAHRVCTGGAAAAQQGFAGPTKARKYRFKVSVVRGNHHTEPGQLSAQGPKSLHRVNDHGLTGKLLVLFGQMRGAGDSRTAASASAGNEHKHTGRWPRNQVGRV